jgi:hypothetical protein
LQSGVPAGASCPVRQLRTGCRATPLIDRKARLGCRCSASPLSTAPPTRPAHLREKPASRRASANPARRGLSPLERNRQRRGSDAATSSGSGDRRQSWRRRTVTSSPRNRQRYRSLPTLCRSGMDSNDQFRARWVTVSWVVGVAADMASVNVNCQLAEALKFATPGS